MKKLHAGLVIALILLHFAGTSQPYETINLILSDSVRMACTKIPPGEFLMGSPDSDKLAGALEKPPRKVVIKHAFYMQQTTVTIKQFEVFVHETGYKTTAETDANGGHGYNKEQNKFEGLFPIYTWKFTGWAQSPNHPVVNVSSVDANEFCKWLSGKTGKTVRLPTEEEWEFACRAGTTTIYFTGDSAKTLMGYANVFDDALRGVLEAEKIKSKDRSFPFNDGYEFTAPVGSFKPNPWGLFDMIGNTYQHCSGIFAPNEPGRVYNHVVRGGSYNSTPEFLRCAFRGSVKSSSKYSYTGFRIIVE